MTTTQRRTARGAGEQRDSDIGHRALPYLPALDGLRAIAVAGRARSTTSSSPVVGPRRLPRRRGVLRRVRLPDHRAAAEGASRAGGHRPAGVLAAAGPPAASRAAWWSSPRCASTARCSPPTRSGAFRGEAVAACSTSRTGTPSSAASPTSHTFGRPSPLGHLWSLSIEEQFYVGWPLLLFVAMRFRSRRVVLGLPSSAPSRRSC